MNKLKNKTFSLLLNRKVQVNFNVSGLQNQSNIVEFDIYLFCKFLLQFTANTLEVYLKLKCKHPNGIIILITVFPLQIGQKSILVW